MTAKYGGDDEDSDEKKEVYDSNASNGLSKDQLIAFINRNHPRIKENKDGSGMKYAKRPIWGTKTGTHSFRAKSRESDLKMYGTGIVVYFQFLKYMACVFILMTVLSIPSLIFFFSGNKSSDYSFKSLVSQFSVGNIGATNLACNSGAYNVTDA